MCQQGDTQSYNWREFTTSFYKLMVFVLLMLLPALACGGESTPTGMPENSTATASSIDSEQVPQVEEVEVDVFHVE